MYITRYAINNWGNVYLQEIRSFDLFGANLFIFFNTVAGFWVVLLTATCRTNFSANCGQGNKLSQIDVALFDHLPDLEKAVVVVTTAATTKRFGINRQCDKPISRLN